MSATQACVSHHRSPAPRPRRYRVRRPERTPLYQAARHHLESWLALHSASEPWDEAVPAFVERDFRKDLDSGILAWGFARARCPAGGQERSCPTNASA
jgi:hypothetical protein